MAHGRPDWLLGTGRLSTYRWAEFDELAARLGSIVTFDRRGDVIYLDTFENGLISFAVTYSGLLASVGLSLERAKQGLFSCKLVPGSSHDLYAGLIWYGFQPLLSKLGAEISFTVEDNISQYELSVYYYMGTNYYAFRIRWVRSSETLELYNHLGIWETVLSDVSLYSYSSLFNTIKLVADPATAHYVRALINSQSVDLSAYYSGAWISGEQPQLRIEAVAYGTSEQNPTCYSDAFIVTQNEP